MKRLNCIAMTNYWNLPQLCRKIVKNWTKNNRKYNYRSWGTSRQKHVLKRWFFLLWSQEFITKPIQCYTKNLNKIFYQFVRVQFVTRNHWRRDRFYFCLEWERDGEGRRNFKPYVSMGVLRFSDLSNSKNILRI